MTKILAQTNFDNIVTLADRAGADLPYVVAYGSHTSEWDTFAEALEEFNSCSNHAASCGGYLDNDDYLPEDGEI
ncbi:hypothetical protein PHB09_152 [Pseudomonas phage PHB09]|uniref:Uncharacterized protein n=1 Tax=Pseudomonas phage PHB09 TaxID=2867265 RepID=A0AAE8XCF5_9CAUD|nr:hypothetical protein QGX10_gp151 [Pseudomonas phage PHB09]UAV84647.1 hypothetical protein PHB09_152 [Pseudomonas phage PHB09]